MKLLPACPPPLLPIAFAALNEWLRDERLLDDFVRWRAPQTATAKTPPGSTDALCRVLRLWALHESDPRVVELLRTAPRGHERVPAVALLEPLPPTGPPPRAEWERTDASRDAAVSSELADRAPYCVELHSKVFCVVMQLRRAGVPLPAPGEPAMAALNAFLLVAAESAADLRISRAWREMERELAAEGVSPLPADAARVAAVRAAGGSRVEGVWAAQEELFDSAADAEAFEMRLGYEVFIRNALREGGKEGRGDVGKKSLEQARRGKIQMERVVANGRKPVAYRGRSYEEDAAATAAHFDESGAVAAGHASSIAQRDAEWLASARASATKVQALVRGASSRKQVAGMRRERRRAAAALAGYEDALSRSPSPSPARRRRRG